MKKQFIRYKTEIYGTIAGAVAGWSYWYFVGCASGTCPITSSPVISSVYGAMMGWLLFSSFKKQKAKEQ